MSKKIKVKNLRDVENLNKLNYNNSKIRAKVKNK